MGRYMIVILVLFGHIVCGQSALQSEKVNWFPFEWDNEEKDAMMVSSVIDTLNFNFLWQFDTGSPYTFMYGNLWESFSETYPYLKNKYPIDTSKDESEIFSSMKEPNIRFGKTPLPNNSMLLMRDYGDFFEKELILENVGASVTIGTIGIDNFRKGVLIIDFKNRNYSRMINFNPKMFIFRDTSSLFLSIALLLTRKVSSSDEK